MYEAASRLRARCYRGFPRAQLVQSIKGRRQIVGFQRPGPSFSEIVVHHGAKAKCEVR